MRLMGRVLSNFMNEIRILMWIIDRPFKDKTYLSRLNCCICFNDISFKYCRRCVCAAFPNPLGSREPKCTHQQLWGSYLDQECFYQKRQGLILPASSGERKDETCWISLWFTHRGTMHLKSRLSDFIGQGLSEANASVDSKREQKGQRPQTSHTPLKTKASFFQTHGGVRCGAL